MQDKFITDTTYQHMPGSSELLESSAPHVIAKVIGNSWSVQWERAYRGEMTRGWRSRGYSKPCHTKSKMCMVAFLPIKQAAEWLTRTEFGLHWQVKTPPILYLQRMHLFTYFIVFTWKHSYRWCE